MKTHDYRVTIRWSGNTGTGTKSYRAYKRDHVIEAEGKPSIASSSDPHFRGDAARWNPEELLVATLSSCHQLAYLHLCADAGILVTAYEDHAQGVMSQSADGGGEFTCVILHPRVTVRASSDAQLAHDLHYRAHALCFIARSVNFEVRCEPVIEAE
ncbi:MAG: peroxiredoxin [Rhodanobacteraceae bacterium]